MAIHDLSLPVNNQQVENLQIGDTVYLTGTVYTARDMAHLELKRLLESGEALPVDLAGRAVFHAGPVVRKTDDGWELVVIGPTTSIRMEPYAQMAGELGVNSSSARGDG